MKHSESHIFVSYSRIDEALVSPLVRVMRATGADVFQDIDSIPYGKLWRPVIEERIELAEILLVFWCEHSERSAAVRDEWQLAAKAGKAIVPVMLDGTPLDSRLGEYQGIDLRPFALAHRIDRGFSLRGIRNTLRRPSRTLREWLARIYGSGATGPARSSLSVFRRERKKHQRILGVDVTVGAAAKLLAVLKSKAIEDLHDEEA